MLTMISEAISMEFMKFFKISKFFSFVLSSCFFEEILRRISIETTWGMLRTISGEIFRWIFGDIPKKTPSEILSEMFDELSTSVKVFSIPWMNGIPEEIPGGIFEKKNAEKIRGL